MASIQQLWTRDIKEYLYKQSVVKNTATDLSAYIKGNQIHIPNNSTTLGIVENRLTYPATMAARVDTETIIALKKYACENPTIFHYEEDMIHSYNKRMSIIKSQANFIKEKFDSRLLWNWANTTSDLDTTGAVNPATGKRRLLFVDFSDAVKRLDLQNVPVEGRACILHTEMFYDLPSDPAFSGGFLVNYLDKSQKNADSDLLRYQGRLLGVDIYTRTWTPRYTDANTKVAIMTVTNQIDDVTVVTTDRYSGIFYQKDAVGYALGDITFGLNRMVPELDNADTMQTVVWGGGERLYTGSQGVVVLRQGE